MTKNQKTLWLVVLMALFCLAATKRFKVTLPRIIKKPTVKRALAGQLMAKVPLKSPTIIVVPREYYVQMHYPTNAHANFGWAVEGSTNMHDWFIVIYPIVDAVPTVYITKPKEFFRVVARN